MGASQPGVAPMKLRIQRTAPSGLSSAGYNARMGLCTAPAEDGRAAASPFGASRPEAARLSVGFSAVVGMVELRPTTQDGRR